MVEAVETMDGWCCLHDLRKVDWQAGKQADPTERKEAIEEFVTLLEAWEGVEAAKEGSHALYRAIGHKGDFMFMILRPSFADIADVEAVLNKRSEEHTSELQSRVDI